MSDVWDTVERVEEIAYSVWGDEDAIVTLHWGWRNDRLECIRVTIASVDPEGPEINGQLIDRLRLGGQIRSERRNITFNFLANEFRREGAEDVAALLEAGESSDRDKPGRPPYPADFLGFIYKKTMELESEQKPRHINVALLKELKRLNDDPDFDWPDHWPAFTGVRETVQKWRLEAQRRARVAMAEAVKARAGIPEPTVRVEEDD